MTQYRLRVVVDLHNRRSESLSCDFCAFLRLIHPQRQRAPANLNLWDYVTALLTRLPSHHINQLEDLLADR